MCMDSKCCSATIWSKFGGIFKLITGPNYKLISGPSLFAYLPYLKGVFWYVLFEKRSHFWDLVFFVVERQTEKAAKKKNPQRNTQKNRVFRRVGKRVDFVRVRKGSVF